MTNLSSFEQHDFGGTNFLSTHNMLKRSPVKNAVMRFVTEKKESIGLETTKWFQNLSIHTEDDEEAICSLFDYLLKMEEKCKTVEQERDSMKQKAYICSLTKSLNRNFFNEFIDAIEERRMQHENKETDENPIFFFYLDLVRFKAINDTHGHEVGDEVLVEFSKRLSSIIRTEDKECFNFEKIISKNFIARVGGDEFIGKINLPSGEHAQNLKTRIQDILKTPFETSVGLLNVGASIGYQKVGKNLNIKEALKEADRKMYENKRS